MKKLLSLLTLLVCVVGGVQADVIYSWEGSADGAIESGGTAAGDGILNVAASTACGTYYTMKLANKVANIPTGAVKITLTSALKEGDQIKVTGFQNKNASDKEVGLYIGFDKGSAISDNANWVNLYTGYTTAQAPETKTYEVASGNVGSTVLTLTRSVSGTNLWINKIEIVRDSRTAVSLSFPEDSYSANLGESFTAPTLTVDPAAASSEVTYSSSDTEVATVDATTGEVSVVALGTTTITAAISGSETYADASDSYTLTVKDPNAKDVTATFPFNTGVAGQTATFSVDDIFSVSYVTVADMTYEGVASDQGVTGTKMQPNSSASDDKSQYVKFTIVPKKGITFTPSNVAFDAMRWATDGSNKLHYYVEYGTTSLELGNINPNRNGKGLGWSHCSHDLSDISITKDNPLTLACYVYGLGTTKQISFANIVFTGTYSGTAEEETEYTITTALSSEDAGSVLATPANTVTEGSNVTLTATANEGYGFANWTKASDTKWSSTDNPLTISNVTADDTYTANFTKLYKVTYDLTDATPGYTPDVEYADAAGKFTAPTNYYAYKEGYTFANWTDGTNDYAAGTEYTLTADITLTPEFTANTKSLQTSPSATTVTWDFQKKNVGEINASNAYFVTQAEVNGETQDFAVSFDKSIYNTNWNDWAHVGSKPTLTIPAVAGMEITLLTYNEVSTSTIAGTTDYTVEGSSNPYTVTYTYTGDASSIAIYLDDASYIRTLKVVYPKKTFTLEMTTSGLKSFASSYIVDGANLPDGLKAYAVSKVSKTAVTLTEFAAAIPAKAGIIFKGTASESYTVPYTATATWEGTNLLTGVVGSAEVAAEDGYTYLALSGGKFVKMTPGTITGNKAYLKVADSDIAGARSLGIQFDGETTGIESVGQEAESNVIYNLQGVRMNQLQKGLNIMNGKKIIVK